MGNKIKVQKGGGGTLTSTETGEDVKIVIADSDPRVRALIKLTLSSYQAVQVFEAADQNETAALVQYIQPDVLIVDERLMTHEAATASPCTTILKMSDVAESNVMSVIKDDMVEKAEQRLTAFLPNSFRRGVDGLIHD